VPGPLLSSSSVRQREGGNEQNCVYAWFERKPLLVKLTCFICETLIPSAFINFAFQNFIQEIRGCQNKEQEQRRVDKELAKIREKFGDDKALDGARGGICVLDITTRE